jgi:membrane protease YdiL (CAAX protease family)
MEIDQQHISETDVTTQLFEPTPAPISPDNPPWGSWAGIGTWAFSVMMIMLMPAIFLAPYLAASGVLDEGSEKVSEFATNDPTAIIVQMAAIIPAHLLTLAFAWVVATRFGQYSFWETLGFTAGGVRWWHYLLIFVGFFALAGVVGLYFPETENQLIRILQSSRTALLIVAFMATFTAPIVEEVIYRGILYSPLQRSIGVPAAVVAVTLIFSLVHVPQYYESPQTIVLLTVLSLILTLMRVFSGSLLPCIILHTMVNGFQSAALILEPYARSLTESNTTAAFLFQ